MAPLDSIAGALSRDSKTPSIIKGDACTYYRLNTTKLQHQHAVHTATALLHCLCTWPL